MANFKLTKDNEIATIWMDQAGSEVNTLSVKMLDNFSGLLDEIEKDSEIKAAVLISKKEYEELMFQIMNLRKFNYKEFLSKLFFDEKDLISLDNLGHNIGLHSHSHPTLIEKLVKIMEVNSGWTGESKLKNALAQLDVAIYKRQDGTEVLVDAEELRRYASGVANAK